MFFHVVFFIPITEKMPQIYGWKLWRSFPGLQYCNYISPAPLPQWGKHINFISSSIHLSITNLIYMIELKHLIQINLVCMPPQDEEPIIFWTLCANFNKVTRGQKVANQHYTSAHDTVQTSDQFWWNFMGLCTGGELGILTALPIFCLLNLANDLGIFARHGNFCRECTVFC